MKHLVVRCYGDLSRRSGLTLYFEEYFGPALEALAPLHNFTLETRIHRFAPLVFEPSTVSTADGSSIFVVEEDDLKAFINEADWNLGISVVVFRTTPPLRLVDVQLLP